ncbi:MAG: hypothetical protein FOGNACKC_01939 [Anaerolineae bacterium]|nr:hypothetical protein [Anaerolineae bacterium]
MTRVNVLIGGGLFAALVMTLFWSQVAAILLAVGYVLAGGLALATIGAGFFGGWILAERIKMLRAARIEAEKQAHVLTITDNGETWVRDTDKRAVWRNLTGTPALYVNGTQHTPADWELEIHKMKLAAQAQTRTATAQILPGTATLLPEPTPIDLLTALDSVQRGLIVGASGSGKTTLLQWLVNRRRQTSKVVVIDPHGWPDKWPGCYTVGNGRNYQEINRGLAGLLKIMDTRYTEIGQGVRRENSHPPLTILIDEWRAIVANLGKPAAETIKALLTESRKAAFTVFVVSHSDRAKPLGLEGEYDLKDGFALVRLAIVNGQRTATIDTGNGPQPATLPGPLPGSFTHYAPPDFDLDLTPEPTEQEVQVLELHRQGASYNEIARQVFGSTGGKQTEAIKQIIAKF